jgi:hypothetical protein
LDVYDQLIAKKRLEYESNVSVLRAAFEAQVIAIQALRAQGVDLPPGATAAGVYARRSRRAQGRLQAVFAAVLADLPSEFDKDVVLAAVRRSSSIETDDRAVSAFLARLANDEDPPIAIRRRGKGRAATVYGKVRKDTRRADDDPGF